ncbi:CPBP family intramembrane metalloprotease [Candidatus Saccharibacteria bacterium]|nr:CPBP family intramembrane metalloprotease [Candidatus Saccharibacteria bacterium]
MINRKSNHRKTTKQAQEFLPKKNGKNDIIGVAIWAVAALGWVFASIVLAELIVGNIIILMIGREAFFEPVPTAIFSVLSYILSFILIAFVPSIIITRWRNVEKNKTEKPQFVKLKTLGVSGLPTWTDIGLSIVGFILYFVIATILIAIFQNFAWFNADEVQNIGFNTNIYGTERIVAFLTLVVLAPIIEELIFRGWLYGKMREKFSLVTTQLASLLISTFLVSLAFGIIHGQWNVGINVFAMSVVACAMREYTGTIYAGILLHIIKNGLAFYYLFVFGIG